MNIERLKEEIKNIQEPRRTRYGNVRHKLEDIIIIGLCTLICESGNNDHKAYHLISAFEAENQLHWCLDVIFHEDASRARKDNSPLNLNVLRKTALNLVSQAQYKRISKKCLMFCAVIDTTLFLDILFDPSSVSPQK